MEIASFEFNLFGVNTYVVWDNDSLEAAVIDPGMENDRECDDFSSFIDQNQLIVKYLINTHLHIDHTLGDSFVEKRYHLGLTAHSADNFLGSNRAQQAAMFHLRTSQITPLEIVHDVKQGDRILLGKDWMEVLEVPGHSPGSIALYSPSGKFVITGDALFQQSVGRTDLPGGNHRQLIGAIKNTLLTLPPDTIVFPGHGPATTIGREKESNPFL